MNWSDYVTALQTMLQLQDSTGQQNLNEILPRFIADAELRMYRDPDLDWLALRTTDRTQQTTAGSRDVPIPTQFIVVEDVALITPQGTQPTDASAQRVPLLRTTRQFIDATWPTETYTQTPVAWAGYWCLFTEEETNSKAIISPTPDGAYVVEFRGTFRPTAFNVVAGFNPTTGVATTPTATTFLSEFLPDLFLAASMIFGAAYQKNFSASSDDPKAALSWETHYQTLKTGAAIESARQKSRGWMASSYGAPLLPQSPTMPQAPASPAPPPPAG